MKPNKPVIQIVVQLPFDDTSKGSMQTCQFDKDGVPHLYPAATVDHVIGLALALVLANATALETALREEPEKREYLTVQDTLSFLVSAHAVVEMQALLEERKKHN